MEREGKGMRYTTGIRWVYDAGRRVGLLLFYTLSSPLPYLPYKHTHTDSCGRCQSVPSIPIPIPSHPKCTYPQTHHPRHTRNTRNTSRNTYNTPTHPQLAHHHPSPSETPETPETQPKHQAPFSLGVHGYTERSNIPTPSKNPRTQELCWMAISLARLCNSLCMVLVQYSTWVGGGSMGEGAAGRVQGAASWCGCSLARRQLVT